jgi:hypothetical protein
VRTKAAQFLVAFSLIVSIGGHWAILQSIGWVGMIASYSRDATLRVALEKTFDGNNPCQICRAVREGKQSEKKEDFRHVDTKLELWVAADASLLGSRRSFILVATRLDPSPLRFETPPAPPPRRA